MNIHNKNTKLILGLVFDALGYVPLIDIIWAPLSAYLMIRFYPGKKGKLAAIVTFIEEALPIDIIPTFTIMWFYTYVFEKNKKAVYTS